LRFPLDKGIITVKCSCGHSFAADPNNPELYKDGKFDLIGPSSKDRKGINWNDLRINFVKSFYTNKYLLQNYRYLAKDEKRKATILLTLFIIVSFIIFAGIFLLVVK